jgi:hypothetical protein
VSIVADVPGLIVTTGNSTTAATWAPASKATEITLKTAIVVAAIFPVLLVLDLPSLMLLNRLRFQKWVFTVLVIRAIANAVRR